MLPQNELRLSALRAFLGRIHPEMRLVKVRLEGDWITVSIILGTELTEKIRVDVSEATTEIIADFHSPIKIEERYIVSTEALPAEDIFTEGWIFQRAE